jgi:recombination protein RecT
MLKSTLMSESAPTKQELAIKQPSLKELISGDKFKEQVALALPKHMTPERFTRIALTAITRTPKLQDCSQASLFKCLLDLSAAGLEPDGRRAYLIPYGNECTLILSYMGMIELVRRSGDVVSIRSELVCENDEFTWENGKIVHKVEWRKPRGEIQAVYAEAVLRSGETQTATMTKDEVDAIRKRSRSGSSGPWVTDYGEMAKKTSLRRLCKLLPLSPEVAEHIERDQDVREIEVIPQVKAALNLPSAQEEAAE